MEITFIENGKVKETLEVDDPLEWIESFQARYRVPELSGLPLFTGGLVGYFGYDAVRYIEPRLKAGVNPDALKTPDILLMVSEEVVVFDNLAGKLYIIVHVDSQQNDALANGEQRLQELAEGLRLPVPEAPAHESRQVDEADFVSGFTEEGYKSAVVKAKQYIVDGDIMQVVLSQRLTIPFNARPLELYRALRSLNPSPYMYYLDLGDHQVVGSSPDILVGLEDGEVTVRPIAGTRPRGKDEAHDKALEEELLADPKELAEHLMLIDLGRNDAGRVSKTGSVELTDKMIVERYSHVMHIVSNVTGELKPELNAMDVLRATFPAGTVSGAPKIRAMQIIDELEPHERSVYCGAIVYFSANGQMDSSITIRTLVADHGKLHCWAGGGLVADSQCEQEYQETFTKVGKLTHTLEQVFLK